MRLPRLTTRRLMVLVAVVALALFVRGWVERVRKLNTAAAYAREAQFWRRQASWSADIAVSSGLSEARCRELFLERSRGYQELSAQYRRAARYPWLPVPPDPPMPK